MPRLHPKRIKAQSLGKEAPNTPLGSFSLRPSSSLFDSSMALNDAEETIINDAAITAQAFVFTRQQQEDLGNLADQEKVIFSNTSLANHANTAKLLLIGDLPTRQPDPDTPLLNRWYSLFPRIPWEATDTDDARAAKIEAEKSNGKFVVAFSRNCASDEKMLKAANLAFTTDSTNPDYGWVTDSTMIDLVLWFADCVGGPEGTVFNP